MTSSLRSWGVPPDLNCNPLVCSTCLSQNSPAPPPANTGATCGVMTITVIHHNDQLEETTRRTETTVKLVGDWTVRAFKDLVHKQFGIPVALQRLEDSVNGEGLADLRYLDSYGERVPHMQVILRLRGGGRKAGARSSGCS